MRLLSLLLILCLGTTVCTAQTQLTENVYKIDSAASSGKASAEDFAMLVGHWTGTGLGGVCDENWLSPADNRMHGVFRLVKDGKIVFTEYMSILQDSAGWALKVKHFTPDFVGWEAKDKSVDFRFIRAEKNALYFSGITFIVEENKKLTIYLAFRQKDKTYREEVFVFTKP